MLSRPAALLASKLKRRALIPLVEKDIDLMLGKS